MAGTAIPFRATAPTKAIRGRRPVRPNVGLADVYRRRIDRLVRAMQASIERWVTAVYRAREPEIATDAAPAIVDTRFAGGARPWQALVDGEVLLSAQGNVRWFKTEAAARAAALLAVNQVLPAEELAAALEDIGEKWRAEFSDAAPRLARYFATAATERSDAVLHRILREGGMTVRFQMTPPIANVVEASIAENVALIKSIPEQYLTNVQGLVMRSVSTGRDLGFLTKALRDEFGVTRRRAEFIARDQNNKATAAITRARQLELNLEEAEWMHSGGGRHPRPTHVANNGKRYNVAEGWLDPAIKKRIWPGTEPNCRCVCRVVIPGLSR